MYNKALNVGDICKKRKKLKLSVNLLAVSAFPLISKVNIEPAPFG
jgi:hypothetical protein